jgi:hypothetical protein
MHHNRLTMQQTRRVGREFGESAEVRAGLGITSPESDAGSQRSLSRGSLGTSALVAGGAQSFHLSAHQGHSCSNAFVFFCPPCDFTVDRALVDKALKLFIRTQTQHLFAATSCISFPQIEEHNFEQGLEFERGLRRKQSDQLFGNVVGPATRERDGRSFRHLRV